MTLIHICNTLHYILCFRAVQGKVPSLYGPLAMEAGTVTTATVMAIPTPSGPCLSAVLQRTV